ncbi:conserved hypothetical protein [Verticillium alfalfae VaMs.102]|uniref:Uncharacterized protein n=1 Tax=Verticillium alfalfae (strain VaMs.102 / ATCC MYA-4576 / FGSC 10136) TaxID=526221 RepID=C9SN92_VERA1|nr:conserved hypothetical protein [Verticillium alfalfae VaMs.102]EEY20257.1 conserved hypothetical protein [Verticillium alfalfae VaMs.102]
MKSMMQSLAVLTALLQSLHVVAQSSTYTTSIITTCITVTPSIATPTKSFHVPDTAVTVFVPDCFQCDCAVCVHTTRLTTTLSAFCPTGIVDRPYVVEHVYSGMSAIPTMTDPTFILAGFTTAVETCTSCGPEPITATLTFPNGGSPYAPEMTQAAAPSRGIKHGPDDWVATGPSRGTEHGSHDATVVEPPSGAEHGSQGETTPDAPDVVYTAGADTLCRIGGVLLSLLLLVAF